MNALAVRVMAVFSLLLAGETALDGLGLTPAWHSTAKFLLIAACLLYLVRLLSAPVPSAAPRRDDPVTTPPEAAKNRTAHNDAAPLARG